MKVIRAEGKVNKAIDALIDLQQDYTEEVIKAGVSYDLQIVLDTLNRIGNAISSIES